MYTAGFEPAIPASDGPQTTAFDRSATAYALVHAPFSPQRVAIRSQLSPAHAVNFRLLQHVVMHAS